MASYTIPVKPEGSSRNSTSASIQACFKAWDTINSTISDNQFFPFMAEPASSVVRCYFQLFLLFPIYSICLVLHLMVPASCLFLQFSHAPFILFTRWIQKLAGFSPHLSLYLFPLLFNLKQICFLTSVVLVKGLDLNHCLCLHLSLCFHRFCLSC